MFYTALGQILIFYELKTNKLYPCKVLNEDFNQEDKNAQKNELISQLHSKKSI